MLGCIPKAGPDAPPSPNPVSSSAQSEQAALGALRYDTGDVTNWPDYHFPLDHSFDIPKVPPEIVGPFPADTVPPQ